MSFRSKPGCKTCQIIKDESDGYTKPQSSRLYKLVDMYHLKGTSLTAIAEEYKGKVTYLAVRNHALKHQNPSEKQLIKTRQREIVTKARREELATFRSHNDNRRELITWLMQQVEEGNVKATLSGLTQLLKQEADIEDKQQDRGLEVFKMMNKFQSGELKRTNDS